MTIKDTNRFRNKLRKCVSGISVYHRENENAIDIYGKLNEDGSLTKIQVERLGYLGIIIHDPKHIRLSFDDAQKIVRRWKDA